MKNSLFDACNAGLLTCKATEPPASICGDIAEKILNKYQNGVTYVDAEWKGNAEMFLDTKFTAKSQFDDADVVEVYEGISNEFKFSTGFRQKTKGREVWESKPT